MKDKKVETKNDVPKKDKTVVTKNDSSIKNISAETKNDTPKKDKSVGKKNDTPIILKSGGTDLRRQEKTLTELVENNYPGGIKKNVPYGFANKTTTTIKLVIKNSDASTIMVKVKSDKPHPWPEYKEKGQEGYTVELNGDKKKEFLKGIGCPENL